MNVLNVSNIDEGELQVELDTQYQVGYLEGASDVCEQFEALANKLRYKNCVLDAEGFWRAIRKIQRDMIRSGF